MMSAAPAAGWFPDPNDATSQRWWDGTQWSEHVAPADPSAPAAAPIRVARLHALPPSPFSDTPARGNASVTPLSEFGRARGSGGGDGTVRPTPKRPSRGMGVGLMVAIVIMSTTTAMNSVKNSSSDIALNVPFTTPDGALSISLPSQPTREEKSEQAKGYTIKYEMYSAELSGDRGLIGVATVDYDNLIDQFPAGDRAAARAAMVASTVLQDAAQGAAASTNGTIESSTPTTVGGHPGLDIKIKRTEPGVAEARIVYIEREAALYTVMVITRNGDQNLFSRVSQTMTLKAPIA